MIVGYTKISEVVREVGLPHLDTELRPDGFQVLADTAHEFGHTEARADVDELPSPPGGP